MDTNCASLLAGLFLYSYQAELTLFNLERGRAPNWNHITDIYTIDGFLSLYNPRFGDYVNVIHSNKLELQIRLMSRYQQVLKHESI